MNPIRSLAIVLTVTTQDGLRPPQDWFAANVVDVRTASLENCETKRAVFRLDPDTPTLVQIGPAVRPNLTNIPRNGLPDFFEGTAAVETVSGGWLLGTDNGEWGGSLYWLRSKHRPQKLLDENVKAIVPMVDRWLVVTGLAHLGMSWGRVYSLERRSERWRLTLQTGLPSAPTSKAVDGERLLLSIRDEIVAIDRHGRRSRVTDATRDLKVSTLLVVGKSVLIVVGPAIGRFDIRGPAMSKIDWWLPPECLAGPKSRSCACAARPD